MKQQKKFLVQQLREFGLNPSLWSIYKLQSKNTWLLIHKYSKELRLKGISTKGKKWMDLEWLI